jgi:hypothetical protein
MSMNLHVEATIEAVSKVGNHTICETFDLWQTPTKVTENILSFKNNEDIANEYIKWIKSLNTDTYEECEYDENDPTLRLEFVDENDIEQRVVVESVRYFKTTYGDEHIKSFKKWLDQHSLWDINYWSM